MNKQLATLLEKILQSCTQCGKCKEECLFLKEFDLEPKELAEKLFKEERLDDVSLIYSCNLCGICKEVCSEDIDLSRLFLLLRQKRVEKGEELFPAYKWVKERQSWFNKGIVHCFQGNTDKRQCESVFFPGCNLCGCNPHLVLKTYVYLTEKSPSTGIILDCCGAPFEGLGVKVEFRKTLRSINMQIEQMGASHIITACPTCYRLFKDYLPQFELSTVYEVMEREGIPETEGNPGYQFFLFHPCATRQEISVKQSVRNLIKKMGYHVLENEVFGKKEGCCGMGGMVGLTNPVLAFVAAQEQTEGIPCDIVTYCATCRDALVQYRPAAHLLDLIFNPYSKHVAERPPLEENQKRKNFIWLKSQFEDS